MITRYYCEICKQVTEHYRFESCNMEDICLKHTKSDVYLCMEEKI